MGDVQNVDALTDILWSKVYKLLMIYLGLPLGFTFKLKVAWKKGRVTLIKSTPIKPPYILLVLFPGSCLAYTEVVEGFLLGKGQKRIQIPPSEWEESL